MRKNGGNITAGRIQKKLRGYERLEAVTKTNAHTFATVN